MEKRNQKILILALLLGLNCFLSGKLSSQNCYIRLFDASGITPTEFQLGALEASACQLKNALPQEFQDSFKVFDIGFYLHNGVMTGGYPEMFNLAINTAQSQSKYYLLFGKQVDQTGIYTKFWIKMNLPNRGQFSCLSNLQRQIIEESIKGSVNNEYSKHSRLFYFYHSAEIAGMDTLGQRINKILNCCFARSSDCYACLSLDESLVLLRDQHGINVTASEVNQILGNTCTQEREYVL